MKNLNVLFAFIMIASVAIFSSCTSDDPESDPVKVTVTEVGSPDYTPGSTVSYQITVASNEELETFVISASTAGGTGSGITSTDPATALTGTEFEKNLHSVTINYDYVIPTSLSEGSEITITFTATDKKTTDEGTGTITVVAAGGPITSWSAELGGGGHATKGSFCVASDGTVYLSSDAADNSGDVDVIYYYGSDAGGSGAGLYAPNSAIKDVYRSGGDYMSNTWSTLNATKFKMATTDDWNNTTDNDQHIVAAAEGASNDFVNIAAADVVAFVTADGLKGLIKIDAINGDNSGTLEISAKVQDLSTSR